MYDDDDDIAQVGWVRCVRLLLCHTMTAPFALGGREKLYLLAFLLFFVVVLCRERMQVIYCSVFAGPGKEKSRCVYTTCSGGRGRPLSLWLMLDCWFGDVGLPVWTTRRPI